MGNLYNVNQHFITSIRSQHNILNGCIRTEHGMLNRTNFKRLEMGANNFHTYGAPIAFLSGLIWSTHFSYTRTRRIPARKLCN